MLKHEVSITSDVAEKLINKLIDKFQYENYGEYCGDEVPFFIATFRWLNPELKGIVTDVPSFAKFLANIFVRAGMAENEVVKAVTNIYNFYDDSDLIPDYRDEDGN